MPCYCCRPPHTHRPTPHPHLQRLHLKQNGQMRAQGVHLPSLHCNNCASNKMGKCGPEEYICQACNTTSFNLCLVGTGSWTPQADRQVQPTSNPAPQPSTQLASHLTTDTMLACRLLQQSNGSRVRCTRLRSTHGTRRATWLKTPTCCSTCESRGQGSPLQAAAGNTRQARHRSNQQDYTQVSRAPQVFCFPAPRCMTVDKHHTLKMQQNAISRPFAASLAGSSGVSSEHSARGLMELFTRRLGNGESISLEAWIRVAFQALIITGGVKDSKVQLVCSKAEPG